MTLKEIMGWDYEDVNRLAMSELKEALKITRHGIRNRKNRILKSDYHGSIALSQYTGRPIRGMTFNQLRAELRKDMNFLDNATSTLGGLRKINKDLDVRLGVAVNPKDFNDYWHVYNKLKEEGKISTAVVSGGSTQLQQLLASIYIQRPAGRRDAEVIYKETKERWQQMYEEAAEREAEEEEYYDQDFYELEDDDEDGEVFY